MQYNPWFTPLVWMDYRLALLFTVIIPLILLIWAFVQKSQAVQRLLIIYWRVSSLLAITVYLMIAAIPISFVSSLLARILIPVSLWFWRDLNEEIEDLPQPSLKLAVSSWRWAITVYSAIGSLVQILFLGCAFSKTPLLNDAYCNVWLQPPLLFKEYFHPKTNAGILGFLGIVGLVVYVACLCYFSFVKLSKQGRSAIEH